MSKLEKAKEIIKENFYKIWNNPSEYIFEGENNPFGDGKASERIYKQLLK